MAIKIKQIFDSDTLSELIEKLNFNFDQVLLNGGGLRGFRGVQGDTGSSGSTGRSGAQIHTGTYPPLNDATSLQIIKDNIINIQLGDYYLYVGADNQGNGYLLGDLYKVVESSGLVVGFTDFELQYQANIRGPEGSDAAALGQTPAYVTLDFENYVRRNVAQTQIDLTNEGRPVPAIKPFMPFDSNFNLNGRGALFTEDTDSKNFLVNAQNQIVLLESYKEDPNNPANDFGTVGMSIDFVIEDESFDGIPNSQLSLATIFDSKKATINYQKIGQTADYLLSIRNLYDSEDIGANGNGNVLLTSSTKGNIDIEYGTDFTIDAFSDVYADTADFDGLLTVRGRRRMLIQNEISGISNTIPQEISIQQLNKSVNNSTPVSEIKLEDRRITLSNLNFPSPTQNILSEPSSVVLRADSFKLQETVNSTYDFLVSLMEKSGSRFYTILDKQSGGDFVVFKTNDHRGTAGINAANAGGDALFDYFLMHSKNSGITYIKGSLGNQNGEDRNVRYEFKNDSLALRRLSETSGGLNANHSHRLPYIEFINGEGNRGLLMGWGTANKGAANYAEIRTENDYSLYVNLDSNAKFGVESDPLTQTQKYAFANGNLTIANTSTNGAARGIYLTESTTNDIGFRVLYNPENAVDLFGIQSKNSVTDPFVNALTITRSTRNIGIKLTDGNDANMDITIGRENVGIFEDNSNLKIRQFASSAAGITIESIGNIDLHMDQNDNDNSSANKKIRILSGGREHARFVDEPTGSITGRAEGHLHFVGNTANGNSSNYIGGITFGHGTDTISEEGGMAGLMVQSGSSGTLIHLMTSNSFAAGRNKRVTIDFNGNLDLVSGNTITVGKADGTESFIRFDSQTNDPGYIRHYESNNVSDMTFVVSDNLSSNDTYTFKGSGELDAVRFDTAGNGYFLGGVSMSNLSVSGNIVANSGNTTGLGFVLSDDGAIVDNNNGYATMKFSSGVIITADKNSDTTRHNFNSDGNYYMNNGGSIIRPSNQTGSITGYQTGSYTSSYTNANDTNPIYVIGTPYRPNARNLGNMYGIGYTNTLADFIADADTGTTKKYRAGAWGMYAAADGDARIFLDASGGVVYGNHFRSLASDGGQLWNIKSIAFNWSNYTYAETADNHGIQSKTHDGNFSDDISINSYGDITLRLDSNANDGSNPNNSATNYLRIYNDTTTDGGQLLHYLAGPSGYAYYRGEVESDVGFRIVDSNTRLLEGRNNSVRVQTNFGYVDIGPQNGAYSHFNTDRAAFYFNQGIQASNYLQIYNTDTYLEDNKFSLNGQIVRQSNDRNGILDVTRKGSTDWTGWGIDHANQHWNFMGNSDNVGIYDDTNNEWVLHYDKNSILKLYHNGSERLRTESGGVRITNNLNVTGDIRVDNDVVITTSGELASNTVGTNAIKNGAVENDKREYYTFSSFPRRVHTGTYGLTDSRFSFYFSNHAGNNPGQTPNYVEFNAWRQNNDASGALGGAGTYNITSVRNGSKLPVGHRVVMLLRPTNGQFWRILHQASNLDGGEPILEQGFPANGALLTINSGERWILELLWTGNAWVVINKYEWGSVAN